MGFLDLFRSGNIRRKWTFTAENSVWKLQFSNDGLIVGEDRNTAAKTVTYFCLDEHDGKPRWLGRKFAAEWWSGIEAVDGGLLLVHSYASPELPEHRGIVAVDLRDGTILWENPDVRFTAVSGGSLLCERFSAGLRTTVMLDRTDGRILHDNLRELPAGPQVAAIDEGRFIFPEILMPDDREAHSAIARLLHGDDLVGSVEYIRRGELLMFNYHEKNAHSTPQQVALTNTFRILSLANEHPVFTETLNIDVPYPAPDSFFIHDETLYYIKDRSILTAVQLREGSA